MLMEILETVGICTGMGIGVGEKKLYVAGNEHNLIGGTGRYFHVSLASLIVIHVD